MSVGVLIAAHDRLGEEFLKAVRQIVPHVQGFEAVSIDPKQSVEEMRSLLVEALDRLDEGDGVLILTDMFGGTPSNISLSLLGERKVEVVTGTNLPMLIKLATMREPKPLDELASFVRDYGQRNISVASELLPDRDA